MNSSLDSLRHDTRQRILYLLKIDGPQPVKALAAALEISSVGTRQHLISMEGAGWIRRHREQRRLGRPQFVYALTKQGDERHFPRVYAPEMLGLLKAIQQLDGAAGLNRIFEHRTEQLAAEYRERISSEDEDLEGRIRDLASIRTEEGFMAHWEKRSEDVFALWENNCAIYQVACSCAQACIFEQELFRSVLDDAEISRESHILSGDSRCTYVIQRKQ